MLIKFNCPCSGPFITTQRVADQLIKAMGKCELTKGIVSSEEIGEALLKIEHQIILEKERVKISKTSEISFSQRAFPLVQMLKKAKKQKKFIMWFEI